MKNRLICIIGPDGVGKSTQADILIRYFENKGIKFRYQWLRFHHLFSLPLLALGRVLGLSEVKTLKNGAKIGYHYFYKSKVFSGLYIILLLIDTYLFTIMKVYIPIKIFRRNIICDRFIYDTLIDLMISTGDYNLYESNFGKLFLNLIPHEAKTIMLLTEEEDLKDRREDVRFDENLNLKINLYKKMAKKFSILNLDASLSVQEIQCNILRYLNEF